MSSKNQVTLTFVGDEKNLERSINNVGAATRDLDENVKKSGGGLKDLQDSFDKTSVGIRKMRDEFLKTGNVDLLPKIDESERDLKRLSRRLDDFARHARGSGEEAGDNLTKGFGARIFGSITTAGSKAGVQFATSLTDAAKPLMGVGAAAALMGVVALAPAIGGLVGVGLVGGIAAKISAGKPEVQAAFKGMTDGVKKDLQSISGPMDQVLIEFARDLRSLSFQAKDLGLDDMFEDAAGMAGQLTSSVRPLVVSLLPGIKDALAGAQPTIDVLQQEIPEIGTAISGFLSDLSEGGENGAQSVQLLLDTLESTLAVTGEAIKLGNKWMSIFPPGILMLTDLANRNKDAGDAANSHAAATEELAAAEEQAAEKAKEEASALQEVIDKMTSLGRLTLTTRDAERDFQESIDSATESLKDNGRTLDVGTEKGRANQAALDAIARSTMNKVTADAKAGAAQSSLNATMARGRDSFIATASAMGMPIARARELAAALFNIPRVVPVTISVGVNESARARQFARAGYGVGGYATGGTFGSSMAWVGERGPELAKFPAGTRIYNTTESKKMASTSGGRTVLEIRSGGTRLDDLLVEVIRNAVRNEGGNVQVVLGK